MCVREIPSFLSLCRSLSRITILADEVIKLSLQMLEIVGTAMHPDRYLGARSRPPSSWVIQRLSGAYRVSYHARSSRSCIAVEAVAVAAIAPHTYLLSHSNSNRPSVR